MPTLLVIKHLDEVEEFVRRVATAREALPELALDGGEEAFHGRVIVAVPGATHTARDALRREHSLVVGAGIRGAAIRMMEQPRAGSATEQGHLQRRDRQMAIIGHAHGPADDEPREKIESPDIKVDRSYTFRKSRWR